LAAVLVSEAGFVANSDPQTVNFQGTIAYANDGKLTLSNGRDVCKMKLFVEFLASKGVYTTGFLIGIDEAGNAHGWLADSGTLVKGTISVVGTVAQNTVLVTNTFGATGASPTCGDAIARMIFYVDGACPSNGRGANAATGGPVRAGYGIHCPSAPQMDVCVAIPNGSPQTNNCAELSGILHLVAAFPNKLEIFTDSMYCINGFRSWMHKWATNGWMNSKEETIEHQVMWQALFTYWQSDPQRIVLSYVKGHSGVQGNEIADRLAVRAASGGATHYFDISKKTFVRL
jgi:ribonuclease HI